ncbi:MAG TPA: sulfotransferase domain-containing protein [Gammaproteobacteria bacterium]|nr:sulfotransferase domain-containing protein [Gammaproteobacteria bacterium]
MSTAIDTKWGTPSPVHDPYALAHFQARPSDVLITTAPKAGTTWMMQILHQLRSGGDAGFASIFDVVPWLEFPGDGRPWQERLAEFERIPNPRVFKTHCTCPQTPGVDKVRIVLTSRDPRDCCVSMYHHQLNMTDEARARMGVPVPTSFDAFFDRWMGFGSWFRNVASWWPRRDADNILWLRYEDLVRDLGAAVDRLLTFLNWTLTATQRERVLEYCSFDWMKRHGDKFNARLPNGKPVFKPESFIRKGAVGDHKTLLRPEQEQAVLERVVRELPAECVAFLGLNPRSRR